MYLNWSWGRRLRVPRVIGSHQTITVVREEKTPFPPKHCSASLHPQDIQFKKWHTHLYRRNNFNQRISVSLHIFSFFSPSKQTEHHHRAVCWLHVGCSSHNAFRVGADQVSTRTVGGGWVKADEVLWSSSLLLFLLLLLLHLLHLHHFLLLRIRVSRWSRRALLHIRRNPSNGLFVWIRGIYVTSLKLIFRLECERHIDGIIKRFAGLGVVFQWLKWNRRRLRSFNFPTELVFNRCVLERAACDYSFGFKQHAGLVKLKDRKRNIGATVDVICC